MENPGPKPAGKQALSQLYSGCLTPLAWVVLMPILEFARDALFIPQLLKSGLYIILPVLVAPQGLIFGLGLAASSARYRSGRPNAAVNAMGVTCIVLATLAILFGSGYGPDGFWGAVLGYFGTSLFCSGCGMIAMLYLTRPGRYGKLRH